MADYGMCVCVCVQGTTHFGGDQLQHGGEGAGSANVSSAILLHKIQQRNAHKSGSNVSPDSNSVEQLKEIRDFIACQCTKDGQATTAELIGRFSGTAHEQSQSTFKLMLKEICEFYREHGTGIWRLKPEYRYQNCLPVQSTPAVLSIAMPFCEMLELLFIINHVIFSIHH